MFVAGMKTAGTVAEPSFRLEAFRGKGMAVAAPTADGTRTSPR